MLWNLIGPKPRTTPPGPPSLMRLVEARTKCELALDRVDAALRRRRAVMPDATPCWYCGHALTPNQVGLPCPRCRDGGASHVTDAPQSLARWRYARELQAAQRNYDRAVAIETR
jgi:hypothetical protein